MVVITGASSGIGMEFAKRFSREGHPVLMLARRQDVMEELHLPNCLCRGVDVTDLTAMEGAIREAEAIYGKTDLLINCAGLMLLGHPDRQDFEEWSRMIDVNVKGVLAGTKVVLADMMARNEGTIINISSMWGQVGGSCEVAYSAAKAGLIGLTKALAKEEGPSGVTVNCVAPGVIDTDMMAAFTPGDKAALAEETPVGRLGNAQEVARALLFLAGEEAGYITGQVFGVNGGLVI